MRIQRGVAAWLLLGGWGVLVVETRECRAEEPPPGGAPARVISLDRIAEAGGGTAAPQGSPQATPRDFKCSTSAIRQRKVFSQSSRTGTASRSSASLAPAAPAAPGHLALARGLLAVARPVALDLPEESPALEWPKPVPLLPQRARERHR